MEADEKGQLGKKTGINRKTSPETVVGIYRKPGLLHLSVKSAWI